MLDIQLIRNDTEAVKRGLETTGQDPSIIDEVLSLDAKRRSLQQEGDTLRAKLNAASKEIGKEKDPIRRADLIAGVQEIKNQIKNNAQEVPLGSLEQLDDDSFTAGWESGPLATFRMMKLCYPHLKGDGCIVNLASAAGKRWDMTGYGAYAATKEAMGWPVDASFLVPDEVRERFTAAMEKGTRARLAWEQRRATRFEADPDLAARWEVQHGAISVAIGSPRT